MSKSGGVLEEVLETGGSKLKQTGKSIVGAVSDTAKAVASQITGQRNKDTQDIVKSLYSQSEKEKDESQTLPAGRQGVKVQDSNDQPENMPEGLEKKKKLQELRQQLHNEVYYDPLVNPKKQQQEERPAKKVEKEKQEEMIELAEKKKREPPPLVQRTQQRVERFPGQSG